MSNRKRLYAVDTNYGKKTSLLSSAKGLSLVEVMMAFLVLLVTSLALMQTALVSIESNMKNVLRDEAASVAEQRLNDARSTPFDAVVSDPTPPVVINRTLKNMQVSYNTTMVVNTLDVTNKQVGVTVTWPWKGVNYTHSATTIIRRQ